MSEVCTITRNAVQEMLELPVAPLTVEIKLPSGYQIKVRALFDKLDAMPPIVRKRLYQGSWERTKRERWLPTDNEMTRLWWKSWSQQPVLASSRPYAAFTATCMPSRNRLLG